jgi:hypothetical protein
MQFRNFGVAEAVLEHLARATGPPNPPLKTRLAPPEEFDFMAVKSFDELVALVVKHGIDPVYDQLAPFNDNEAVGADLEAMNKLLESDDALATAHAEVKRLNHLVSQLQVRISVLMREKNAAIDMVKEYQAKEKKAKK